MLDSCISQDGDEPRCACDVVKLFSCVVSLLETKLEHATVQPEGLWRKPARPILVTTSASVFVCLDNLSLRAEEWSLSSCTNAHSLQLLQPFTLVPVFVVMECVVVPQQNCFVPKTVLAHCPKQNTLLPCRALQRPILMYLTGFFHPALTRQLFFLSESWAKTSCSTSSQFCESTDSLSLNSFLERRWF